MTRSRRLAAFAVLLSVLATAGCHTMRFQVTDAPHQNVVYDRKAYFLWGLAPTRKVDVLQHCPNGVTAIREQTTFVDGIFSLFTLGLYEPRSSWYYCRAEAAGGVQ